MPKKPVKNSDIERAGRILTAIFESGYISRKRLLYVSFIKGIAQGVGGFIGATLGVGLLLWSASLLLDVPILGSIIEALRSIST